MYHSITFITNESIMDSESQKIFLENNIKNTYDSWFLIPTSRPHVVPPSPKNRTVDVPGMNGVADFSTALTGYPLYNNRSGSWEFMIDHWNDNYSENWQQIYSSIMDWLQGKKDYICILEDDQSWYYKGKFTVSGFNSGDKYSTITISYDLYPYKRAAFMSDDRWLWDPFDFDTGVIPTSVRKVIYPSSPSYKDIYYDLNNTDEWYYVFGSEPVIPTIHVYTSINTGIDIKFTNNALNKPTYILHIPEGQDLDIVDPNIVMGGSCLESFMKIRKEYTDNGVLKGDINDDGYVTSDDVSLALAEYQRILDGFEPTFTPRQFEAADMDGDGVLSIDDIMAIKETYTYNSGVIKENRTFRLQVKGYGSFKINYRQGRL